MEPMSVLYSYFFILDCILFYIIIIIYYLCHTPE
jgi:hypothetical protein